MQSREGTAGSTLQMPGLYPLHEGSCLHPGTGPDAVGTGLKVPTDVMGSATWPWVREGLAQLAAGLLAAPLPGSGP